MGPRTGSRGRRAGATAVACLSLACATRAATAATTFAALAPSRFNDTLSAALASMHDDVVAQCAPVPRSAPVPRFPGVAKLEGVPGFPGARRDVVVDAGRVVEAAPPQELLGLPALPPAGLPREPRSAARRSVRRAG
jgi:hypothetical protein